MRPSELDKTVSVSAWPLWLCAVLATTTVMVTCFLQAPIFATSSDYVQALFAEGDYMAAPSGHLLPYSLAPVSLPLSYLYALAPSVAWYTLFLLALIALSFAVVISRLGMPSIPPVAKVCLAILLLSLEVVSLLYLTYTLVAFLALAAGLYVLVTRVAFGAHRCRALGYIAAYLLIGAGFSLCPANGLATLVVFVPFFAWALVHNHRLSAFVRIILACAVCIVCYRAGVFAYAHTAGWETYLASSALELPTSSGQWAGALGAYVCPQTVIPLCAIALFALVIVVFAPYQYRAGKKDAPMAALDAPAPSLVPEPLEGTTSFERRELRDARRAQRQKEVRQAKRARGINLLAPAASIVIAAACIAVFAFGVVGPLRTQNNSAAAGHIQNYIDAHPDELVLFNHNQSILFVQDAFAFTAWECPDTVIFIGEAENASASWYQALARMGFDNHSSAEEVLLQLTQRSDMVAALSSTQAKQLQLYLTQSTGSFVNLYKVEDLGLGTTAPSLEGETQSVASPTSVDVSIWKFASKAATIDS